jgi:formylglycine-generating enzyme required for sulfatase activity
MSLRLIPAGEFLMGSPNWDKNAAANERPAHLVRITRAFYVGVYKVTRQQFRQFVTSTNYKTAAETQSDVSTLFGKKTWIDPGFYQDDTHPVVCVTWEDAGKFCAWMTSKEHVTYRLPTEAEWEYACRGGAESRFFYGNDETKLGDNAWYFGNAKAGATHPLGQKPPNAWGLYDVCGNAMEWCSDWYDKDWYASSGAKNDPVGPESGTYRVIRGAWFHASSVQDCRLAKRSFCPPSTHLNGLSFRVVVELP